VILVPRRSDPRGPKHQRQLPRAGLRTLALVWVVVGASLTASLVQYVTAKLAIAAGRSLAENCRERYRRGVRLALWIQAELVVIMTDLAVVLGLRIRGYEGIRPVLLTLFGLILVLLVAQVIVAGVDEPAFVRGLVPQPLDGSAALLAVGIIGATVMPHALHFHSAVAREDSRPKGRSRPSGSGWRCWRPACRRRSSASIPARSSCKGSGGDRSPCGCNGCSRSSHRWSS
jgi:Mn2+/Fe2+ NRAMP family transporter